MSTDTPVTDGMQRAAIVVKLNYMAKQYTNGAIARGGSLSKHYLEEAADIIKAQEAENASLREEVEMLNVRHAAAMLHAQTHADEYNALREDEKGLLQDIARLTEEAFKRDEELAEAKRGSDRLLSAMQAEEEKLRPLIEKAGCDPQHHGADIAIKELLQRAEQAEARALAAEKLHMDLIMQVARKWPNESRHETAKRYITEAENRPSSGPSQAAVGAKHD
jgi:hypothetical protein